MINKAISHGFLAIVLTIVVSISGCAISQHSFLTDISSEGLIPARTRNIYLEDIKEHSVRPAWLFRYSTVSASIDNHLQGFFRNPKIGHSSGEDYIDVAAEIVSWERKAGETFMTVEYKITSANSRLVMSERITSSFKQHPMWVLTAEYAIFRSAEKCFIENLIKLEEVLLNKLSGKWLAYKKAVPATKLAEGAQVQTAVAAVSAEPAQVLSDVDISIPKTGINNKNAVAVVIGNRDYVSRDIPSVEFAVNDAKTMKKYLVNVLGYREGNILYQPNASKATFESIFGTRYDYQGKLYNYLIEGKSDIFIFYSGHGAPDLKKKEGYFVPVDADPQTINLTGYPLKQLYENIAKIAEDKKSPNVFIVVDACFSGSSEKGLLLKNASPITIKVKNSLVNRPNTVVFTSSSGAEISSWYPEKGHSMFTYFFLKALQKKAKKKGTVTAGEIFDFIADKSEGVPYYARRLHGRIQTPQITGNAKRVLFSK
ncbi:MAG: caspase family protein [Proteobacteria bacterium]|nr:caspase family protein [Pseudomonadota bacterium]